LPHWTISWPESRVAKTPSSDCPSRALGSKLWALTRLGHIEPAGASSDALLTLFTGETNPEAVAELGRQVLRGVQTLMHTPKSPSRRQVATRRLASTILGTLNRPNSGASTDQQAEADDQRVTSPPRSRGRFWRTVEREQWRSEQALKLAVALLRRFERTPDERLFSLAVQGQAYRFVALKRLGRWRDLRDAFVEGAPAGHNNFITANGDGADDERQQKRAAGVLMARAMRIEREANPVRTAQAYGTFAQQFQQAKSLPVQSLVKLARKAQQKAQAG
jgi:hypothetical protein